VVLAALLAPPARVAEVEAAASGSWMVVPAAQRVRTAPRATVVWMAAAVRSQRAPEVRPMTAASSQSMAAAQFVTKAAQASMPNWAVAWMLGLW